MSLMLDPELSVKSPSPTLLKRLPEVIEVLSELVSELDILSVYEEIRQSLCSRN